MKDMKLRPGQDKVLEYSEGRLAIPSVPGAGKTFTLTALTSKLIKEGRHLPGRILIVTYMNSAVNNFKSRIGEFLEELGLPKNKGFEVMTLHSLAMKIIKEKPAALYLSEDFQPIDEIEQIRIIQRETAKWIEVNKEQFQSYIYIKSKETSKQIKNKNAFWADKANQLAREMISYFKCNRIAGEDIPQIRKDIPTDSLLNMCLSVYEQYELFLRTMGKLDFDDLIIKSIDLVKSDEELRERLQNTYTYIFEDEAQDSSRLQEELLFLLSGKHRNLVRVGDTNQSIMSTFTLSDPKLFKAYCESEGTEVSEILVSSRSSRDIIDLANYFVKWTKEYHPMNAARDSLEPQFIEAVDSTDPFPNPIPKGYTIGTLLAKTRKEELQRIAASLTKQLDKEKTVAVLLPNSYVMDELKEVLDREKIPYNEISSFPTERTKAVESLAALLDYIAHPNDNQKIIRVLKYTLPGEILEDAKMINFLSNCNLEELLYPLDDKKVVGATEEFMDSPGWKLMWESLKAIKGLLEASFLEPEAFILLLAESLHFDDNQMAVAQRIAGDIRYMVLLNPGWGMGELAEQLKQIRNVYNYFANIVYERFGFEAEAGVVNLITYHKSKGLEFDTVYLTCLTTEEFPSTLEDKFRSDFYFLKDSFKNPAALCKAEFDKIFNNIDLADPMIKARLEQIQERLRLLYVGVTRAKENLLLSSHEAYDTDFGRRKVCPSLYFYTLKSYIERRR